MDTQAKSCMKSCVKIEGDYKRVSARGQGME